ncbi:hypothetical protein CC78DRAFT_568842 [Lojkania enalia]|uniref:Heterokaryon incompatibility domain-containing protein n=1 Tax=Lojkania enalia TaxID=147567 RepID=A0A9P4K727_9PLEO|nr:hypothetical protein CC78DRAFT_568842 [Didymosphaeria enalia]
MATQYKYCKFTAPRQFRLLRIYPALEESRERRSSNEPPSTKGYSLDLITTLLDNAPSFETVPYVWGTGNRNVELEFKGGSSLKITQRLFDSLIELTRNCSTGYLWIDQICIDQENDREKAHQIPLMAEIYKSCDRVLIYLASDLFPQTMQDIFKQITNVAELHVPDAQQAAMDLAKKAVAEYLNDETGYIQYEKVGSHLLQFCRSYQRLDSILKVIPSPLRRIPIVLLSSYLFKHVNFPFIVLYLFFSHPWFGRAWTFQERALPRRHEILVFGSKVDWKVLDDITFSSFEKYAVRESDPTLIYSFLPVRRGLPIIMRPKYLEKEKYHFTSILNAVLPNNEVSVHQDLVYAFYEFIDKSIRPPIDYSLSWAELFTRVTGAGIDQCKDLHVFQHLQRHSTRQWDGRKTLPSWVPNWSERPIHRISLESMRIYGKFNADLSRQCLNPTTDNVFHLRVRGHTIDAIESIFESYHRSEDIEETISRFPNFVRTVQRAHTDRMEESIQKRDPESLDCTRGRQSMIATVPNSNQMKARESVQYTIASIVRIAVVCDIFEEFEIGKHTLWTKSTERDFHNKFVATIQRQTRNRLRTDFMVLIEEFNAWFSNIIDSFVHSEKFERCLMSLLTSWEAGTVLLTSSGRMGFVYGNAMAKDIVCILHGSRVPVVLRPANDRMYRVIGWCYLDNVVFGEAVTWKEDEAAEFILC